MGRFLWNGLVIAVIVAVVLGISALDPHSYIWSDPNLWRDLMIGAAVFIVVGMAVSGLNELLRLAGLPRSAAANTMSAAEIEAHGVAFEQWIMRGAEAQGSWTLIGVWFFAISLLLTALVVRSLHLSNLAFLIMLLPGIFSGWCLRVAAQRESRWRKENPFKPE